MTVDPQGRAIVFQVRARSIGVTPRARWVDPTLWMKGQQTRPGVRKVDDHGSLGRIPHFRLISEEDVDRDLVELLREACRVGAQDTLAPTPRRPTSRREA